MNRRSFLTRIAKAVAIAVAAPVIVREVVIARLPEHRPPLDLKEFLDTAYRMARIRKPTREFEIYCDSATAEMFRKAVVEYYEP